MENNFNFYFDDIVVFQGLSQSSDDLFIELKNMQKNVYIKYHSNLIIPIQIKNSFKFEEETFDIRFFKQVSHNKLVLLGKSQINLTLKNILLQGSLFLQSDLQVLCKNKSVINMSLQIILTDYNQDDNNSISNSKLIIEKPSLIKKYSNKLVDQLTLLDKNFKLQLDRSTHAQQIDIKPSDEDSYINDLSFTSFSLDSSFEDENQQEMSCVSKKINILDEIINNEKNKFDPDLQNRLLDKPELLQNYIIQVSQRLKADSQSTIDFISLVKSKCNSLIGSNSELLNSLIQSKVKLEDKIKEYKKVSKEIKALNKKPNKIEKVDINAIAQKAPTYSSTEMKEDILILLEGIKIIQEQTNSKWQEQITNEEKEIYNKIKNEYYNDSHTEETPDDLADRIINEIEVIVNKCHKSGKIKEVEINQISENSYMFDNLIANLYFDELSKLRVKDDTDFENWLIKNFSLKVKKDIEKKGKLIKK